MGGQRNAPAALATGKRPGTHFTKCWLGPQGRFGRVRKISPPPVFDYLTVESVTICCIDCAIPISSVWGLWKVIMFTSKNITPWIPLKIFTDFDLERDCLHLEDFVWFHFVTNTYFKIRLLLTSTFLVTVETTQPEYVYHHEKWLLVLYRMIKSIADARFALLRQPSVGHTVAHEPRGLEMNAESPRKNV